MVATSCFGLLSTSLSIADFRPKMALTLEILSETKCTLYLGIALSTQFSSSSLVLGGLNLHSAICFAKQRVRSELTNKLGDNVTSVDEYSKIVRAPQLGDRIMHIMQFHVSSIIVELRNLIQMII